MEHTPYGYDIIGGRAVINEEQAAVIRKVCENDSFRHLNAINFLSKNLIY